jgi:hypothetical protein
MAEFFGEMKPSEYKKLTRTQRSWLWVGAFVALGFQSFLCFFMGVLLHNVNHGG